jgi:hypothetical protein
MGLYSGLPAFWPSAAAAMRSKVSFTCAWVTTPWCSQLAIHGAPLSTGRGQTCLCFGRSTALFHYPTALDNEIKNLKNIIIYQQVRKNIIIRLAFLARCNLIKLDF